jgi:hypothetical protein
MSKILKLTAATALPMALLLGGQTVSAGVSSRIDKSTETAFKYAPKSKYEQANSRKELSLFQGKSSKSKMAKVVTEKDLEVTLPAAYSVGYLDAPDGSTWFYTSEMEYDEVALEGGYATQKNLSGFKFTIYDSNYKEVGSIHDTVTVGEGESRIGAIQIGACVTQKFFNSDNNYEVMVMIAANTPEYVNHYYTKVYSIGSESSEAISTIEGYYVDAVNAGQWSEKYYITFYEEAFLPASEVYGDETAGDDTVYALHYDVYGPATWSDPQASIIKTLYTPYDNFEGNDGLPFISVSHDNKPYFAIVRYEKPYFANDAITYDPTTGEMSRDMTANPDNNFIIDLYTYSTYGGFSEVNQTKIPMELKDETGTQCCSFYEIGVLNYADDVSYDMWTNDDQPSFVVAIEDYKTSTDESVYAFKVFDINGNKIADIAEDTEGLIDMTDIKGFEHQQGFYKQIDGEYVFQFVDMPSCTVAATLKVEQGDNSLTSSADRYLVGNKYQYAISMYYGVTDDDDNTSHYIGWFKTDGTLDHYDIIPLGKQVAMAYPYIKHSVLNPYLFNTDNKREYMFLVKNYISSSSTETVESLIVYNTDGDVLAKLSENEEYGSLMGITLINTSTDPALWFTYYNDETDAYTSSFINLPFAKFQAGGDGSVENPYLISTVGDLQQIKYNLTANYKLANDVHASSYEFQPIAGDFTGTLDGDGYSIIGLNINSDEYYSGIFQSITGTAVVKNINFVNPVIVANEGNSVFGLVAATAMGNGSDSPLVSNIHIVGFDASATEGTSATVAGIVGKASLGTTITLCSNEDANFDMPYDGSAVSAVGGIVGDIRTGCVVKDCVFTGYLSGGVAVGGIAATTTTGDETISNCHVNAEIVGQNTIGGIVGSAARTSIKNCYVEGTLSAIKNQSWGAGAQVGGIAGKLEEDWANAKKAVISNNVIALSSISEPELPEQSYDNQATTAHRVVGYTIYNSEPDGTYTQDETTGEWTFVAGKAADADNGLANNYVVEGLDVVDSNIEATATSTEGETITAASIDKAFLEGLGFSFGETEAEPWSFEDNALALYFEGREYSSVANLKVGSATIQRAGNSIIAEGCDITVYNLNGVKLVKGANSVSTLNLNSGVYVIVAVDANGVAKTAKIAIK